MTITLTQFVTTQIFFYCKNTIWRKNIINVCVRAHTECLSVVQRPLSFLAQVDLSFLYILYTCVFPQPLCHSSDDTITETTLLVPKVYYAVVAAALVVII